MGPLRGRVGSVGSPVSGVRVTQADGRLPKSANLAIPDNNATGITDTMNVTVGGTISRFRSVEIAINHTYIGDLEVTVIHPDGTAVLLHNRTGLRTTNIVGFYSSVIPPNGNTFAPVQSLNVFNGKSAAGSWQVRVRDLASADTGSLSLWSLEFDSQVTSDGGGNYDFGIYPL